MFGSEDDPQVSEVSNAVSALGSETVILRLDASEMTSWSWSTAGIVRADGTRLDDLRAIYVRSVSTPTPQHRTPVVAEEDQAEWLERAERSRRMLGAARAAQRSLADRGVEMVNPVEVFWMHRSKPGADQQLARHGVRVPRGLVTTDLKVLGDFIDEVGEVVYKPVAGGGACRLLDKEILSSDGAALRLTPVLFQERIRGRDLRIYVVDGAVVGACVIHTEAVDYRGNETGVEEISVANDLEALALRAADVLGMVFTGIDIKESHDGSLTVLDVNPSPMFAGAEVATGMDIAGPLARHLVGVDT